VVVDATRWGERDRERPALVQVLQAAVVRRRKVRLTYAGRRKEPGERLVDPWGLVDKDDVWYLVAGTPDGQRTFRVDRVADAAVTDLAADRPPGFELGDAWAQVVDEVEVRRSLTSATVLVETALVSVLRGQFGRHCEPVGTAADGRAEVRLRAPTALDIARHLAGWGTQLEVVEPDAVADQLARIGAELTARYAR
jgi:predicted DNA-binding transcriptional regulator YafY